MAGETNNNDNVEDFVSVLQEEEEDSVVQPPEKEDEEVKEPEEEEEEPEKEPADKEDEEEEKPVRVQIPNYKEVVAKYPNLFKEFPSFKHIFFHAKEYRELFPTVDDAREAVEKLESFDTLEKSLIDGSVEETTNVLKSINEIGDEALPNFATNFLPSIKKMNQDLYFSVITPELVSITRSMFDAGLRNENENLKNAALVVAQHLFGDQKVASGEREVKSPEVKTTKRDDKLERERSEFKRERYTTFYNDVVGEINPRLEEIIQDGLDNKNAIPTGMKKLMVKEIVAEIGNVLGKDPIHTSRMNNLWKKANDGSFPRAFKSKIVSAYLEAAEEIMPKIRAKVRASTLGIRERRPEQKTGEERKRIEPRSSTGGGGHQSKNKDGSEKGKTIDWRKTSELDYIRGNITYK